VQQLKNDNQRMLKILSELLNMSQVEAGKIQLNMQYVSAYPIVETSIEAVSNTAREKNITIEKKLEDDLPGINTDADKISWVLNNFLTNASRYSPSGSAIIVSVEKTGNRLFFQLPIKVQELINRISAGYLNVTFKYLVGQIKKDRVLDWRSAKNSLRQWAVRYGQKVIMAKEASLVFNCRLHDPSLNIGFIKFILLLLSFHQRLHYSSQSY
jgi:hypothetical protein